MRGVNAPLFRLIKSQPHGEPDFFTEREGMVNCNLRAAVETDKKADGGEAEDNTSATVANEGKWEAVIWKDSGSYSDVHHGRNNDHTGEAKSNAALKNLPRLQRDTETADGDNNITDDHSQGAR